MNNYIKSYLNPDTGKAQYRSIGSAIKANGERRIGGYLIRFTNSNDPDLHGEYFDKQTNFWLKEHPIEGRPVLIDHAFDDKFKSIPVGIIDFIREDEIGLWIEAKLHEREQYEEYVQEWRNRKFIDLKDDEIGQLANGIERAVKAFFDTGKAQWSSGALPQSVEVNSGHIDSWATIEATAVMTPAEPDGTQITSVKTALDQLSNILNRIQPSQQAQRGDTGHDSVQADVEPAPGAKPDKPKLSEIETQTGDNIMPTALELAQALVEALQAQAEEMGVSEEEAPELAKEVVQELVAETEAKAEGDEEEEDMMDEEEQAKGLAQRAYQLLTEKIAKRAKAASAAKGTLDALHREWQKAQQSTIVPVRPYNGNQRNGRIEMATKYRNWNAEDFSFALTIAQLSANTSMPMKIDVDQKFYREFADKAESAYNKGLITLDNNAIKGINAIKADELDYSTQAGFGDEWVFTAWSEQIWDKPRLDNVVVPAFSQIEMPSNPYEYPVESTDPSVFFVAETTDETQLGRNDSSAALPDTKVGTGKVQFNAKKHAIRVTISAELEEDSIARLMPKFREQTQRVMMDSHDKSVLVGDTSASGNINLDGGTPGATTNYMAYDGLVHQALVTATTNALDAGGAAPTLSHIRSLRALLGNAEGWNPTNLALFCDFSTYMKLLSVDAVVTLDKFGPNATVVNGTLGMIDGINVFVSDQMPLADTDGKVTSGGNVTNTGRLALVHKPTWFIGYRRRVAQYLNYLPFADSWELVMTMRTALTARTYNSSGAQQSTDDSVAVLYNIGI